MTINKQINIFKMNSVLEQQRRLHEEIERIENAIVDELLVKPKAVKIKFQN